MLKMPELTKAKENSIIVDWLSASRNYRTIAGKCFLAYVCVYLYLLFLIICIESSCNRQSSGGIQLIYLVVLD